MQILLTNDDGIYAPGLFALERQLRRLGDVTVVAPATEQSGVGHSITFLRPLVAIEVYHDGRLRGWAVEGSPADCVKLGVFEFCPQPPDLIVSGINAGLNAGINVLYSGTVSAAIEGGFFGITSVAVSLESDPLADYDRAAEISVEIISKLISHQPEAGQVFNLNLPRHALYLRPKFRVVPMGLARYGEHFERRTDPRGRPYFWATSDPPPPPNREHDDDLTALEHGYITLTPLDFNLTQPEMLEKMREWKLDASNTEAEQD